MIVKALGRECPKCIFLRDIEVLRDDTKVKLNGWYTEANDRLGEYIPCDHKVDLAEYYVIKTAILTKKEELRELTKYSNKLLKIASKYFGSVHILKER